jgi:hypothetical protein
VDPFGLGIQLVGRCAYPQLFVVVAACVELQVLWDLRAVDATWMNDAITK